MAPIRLGPITIATIRQYRALQEAAARQAEFYGQQAETLREAANRVVLAAVEQAGGDPNKTWSLLEDGTVVPASDQAPSSGSGLPLADGLTLVPPKREVRDARNADDDGLSGGGQAAAL